MGSSSGNPAGYVLLQRPDELSKEEMQKIASQLKGFVNEVGFAFRRDKEFDLKYYSAECEVAFCGHATIAIMYDLISTDPELLNEKELKIKSVPERSLYSTMSGTRTQFISWLLFLNILSAASALMIQRKHWMPQLRLFDARRPLRVIDGGLRTLIVPMASLKDCLDLCPDQEKLREFCLKKDFDIVHVYTDDVSTEKAGYRTRVFAPKYGYLEDPATGSGNSAFGYYLLDEGLWEDDFAIEQGPSLKDPNVVRMKRYKEGDVDRILFGGSGTTRIEGRYHLC